MAYRPYIPPSGQVLDLPTPARTAAPARTKPTGDVCRTCHDPTTNRDTAGHRRCPSCCDWLAAGIQRLTERTQP